MYCPHCSQQISDQHTFCFNCGSDLSSLKSFATSSRAKEYVDAVKKEKPQTLASFSLARTSKSSQWKSKVTNKIEILASDPDSPKASSSGAHSTTVNHVYSINNSSGFEQSAGDNIDQPQTERSKHKEVFSDEDSSNLSELSDEDKCKTLLQVCSWIHEVNDENLTQDIVAHLPDHIMLSYTKILPSDVYNMFHALRLSSKSHTIDVVWCDFTGFSLELFSEEVSSFNIKIQRFHLDWKELSDDDFSSVVEISQHVEELLRLRWCGITSCQVSSLAEKFSETGHKIQWLDLSYNNFGDGGLLNLVLCLKNIQKLELIDCDISSAGCAKFAEKFIETGHKLELLNLSNNDLIGDGARSLIPCLHLIEKLWLMGCNVTEAVKEEIRSELKTLDLPEHRVYI